MKDGEVVSLADKRAGKKSPRPFFIFEANPQSLRFLRRFRFRLFPFAREEHDVDPAVF